MPSYVSYELKYIFENMIEVRKRFENIWPIGFWAGFGTKYIDKFLKQLEEECWQNDNFYYSLSTFFLIPLWAFANCIVEQVTVIYHVSKHSTLPLPLLNIHQSTMLVLLKTFQKSECFCYLVLWVFLEFISNFLTILTKKEDAIF